MTTTTKRFQVALSFPGEKRVYIKEVADCLAHEFGKGKVLYDKFHQAEFARPNLGMYLPTLYYNESELVVVFLCADYEGKDWCGLEWNAIYAMIKEKRYEDIMFFRFDYADISGLFGTEGAIDIDDALTPQEAAALILERYQLNHP